MSSVSNGATGHTCYRMLLLTVTMCHGYIPMFALLCPVYSSSFLASSVQAGKLNWLRGCRWPISVTGHRVSMGHPPDQSTPTLFVPLYVFYPPGRWERWVEVWYLRHQIWTILGWKTLCCLQLVCVCVCVDFQHHVFSARNPEHGGRRKTYKKSTQSRTSKAWMIANTAPPTYTILT